MLRLFAFSLAFVAAQTSPLFGDADARGRRGHSFTSFKAKKSRSGSARRNYGAGSGGSGGAAYYANCSAARAAGAAPVMAGDPGYSRKLDRDGDGIGCE